MAQADGLVEVAEGWAFAAPILPLVAACNATVGELVYKNMYLNAPTTNVVRVPDGFQAVKAALESVYPCLGITCDQVGGMLSNGQPIPTFLPCGLASPPPSMPPPLPPTLPSGHDHAGLGDHDDDHEHDVMETEGGKALLALTIIFGVATAASLFTLIITCSQKAYKAKPPKEVAVSSAKEEGL